MRTPQARTATFEAALPASGLRPFPARLSGIRPLLPAISALLLGLTPSGIAAPPQRPFPQHTTYAPGALRPSLPAAQLDAAVASAYDAWKKRYLRAGCEAGQAYVFYNLEGQGDPKDAITVSEAHGYGMLLTAFFAGHDPEAQATFDALFAYYRAHPSGLTPGLMAWQQRKGCRTAKGDDDSASDGDLDIAYALLLAGQQWGNTGPIRYGEEARKVIAAIEAGEVNTVAATVKLGDWETDSPGVNDIRLSDFMPEHFRAFAKATGDPLWPRMVERGYAGVAWLQSHHSPTTGLLPDFARGAQDGQPVPAGKKFLESKFDGQYYYNACRIPWRLGVDALLTGEPRAKASLTLLNHFIEGATGGDPAAIHAGYRLTDGKVLDRDDTSLAFTGPFAVSAMIPGGHQEWLDRLCEKLRAPLGEDDDYYGRTVSLLSLVAVSGNWWSP